LEKDVAKERITKEEAEQARQRLSPTTNIEDLKDVDFVIEAVPVRSSTLGDCLC
jgi:3-hydroxybutyryl-CoA dehydrogenase